MNDASHEYKSSMYRKWESGQNHLAQARYQAACTALKAAERAAWRARDAASLARIWLPLLEVRRQIRQQAVEGTIVVLRPMAAQQVNKKEARRFIATAVEGGTMLLSVSACGRETQHARRLAAEVAHAARKSGKSLETLLLLTRGNRTRIASPAEGTFVGGLDVLWTRDAASQIGASTESNLAVPLPPPGAYEGRTSGAGALARESLLIAWEALALRWQHRHPPPRGESPWQELAWLRRTLDIDPACEPAAMRLTALAEAIERTSPR